MLELGLKLDEHSPKWKDSILEATIKLVRKVIFGLSFFILLVK
jgi:hypothetical protein